MELNLRNISNRRKTQKTFVTHSVSHYHGSYHVPPKVSIVVKDKIGNFTSIDMSIDECTSLINDLIHNQKKIL